MTAIFTRSALVHWGHNPAPDVHSVVVDHDGRHVVTWAEVMQRRRARQVERAVRWERMPEYMI